MSSELDTLIVLGNDIAATRYFVFGTGAILFYDYFLTLSDEIEYVWSGSKSWAFWLFIFNRYFPMTYQFWQIVLAYTPNVAEVYGLQLTAQTCDKSLWYADLVFVICTVLAQVVLTLRIYAVSMKSVPIAIGFATITASQFAVGMYMTIITGREGAIAPPPIPNAFNLCLFSQHRDLEIASISISLFYDSLAFMSIIFLAARSGSKGVGIPAILKTMTEDATRYFLIIATSHIVVELTLNLGRETIQLLPASGNVVFLPVMISRIMLSLRKAAYEEQTSWYLGGTKPSNSTNLRSIKFFRPWKATDGGDVIPLHTSPESSMATQ